MKNKNKLERCIWCGSSNTYLLGASGFDTYMHCSSCSADYIVSMREYAWTSSEVDEHNELIKEQFKTE